MTMTATGSTETTTATGRTESASRVRGQEPRATGPIGNDETTGRAIREWCERLEQLSDAALIRRTEALVARSRRVTAALVLHLAEVERRAAHLRWGYASLFAYCTERLQLSEAAAYQRIRAARVVRDFPEVAALLARGELHLSGLALLAPRLERESASDLLSAARGKSKREIERLLAEREPKPPVPDQIRRLPSLALTPAPGAASGELLPARVGNSPATPELAPAGGGNSPATPELAPAGGGNSPATPKLAPARVDVERPAVHPAAPTIRAGHAAAPSPVAVAIEPLGRARYRIQLTGGEALVRTLEKARALSAHRHHGELGAVIEAALVHYAAHLEKRRFGLGARPRRARKASASETVTAPKASASETTAAPKASASETVTAPKASASETVTAPKTTDSETTDAPKATARETASSPTAALQVDDAVSSGDVFEAVDGSEQAQWERAVCPGHAARFSDDVPFESRCGSARERSRYVSVEVRRIVAARDGLRCSYRAPDGTRCQARHYLEIDHRRPFALGGANVADNLRLLCRAHNQLRLRERARPLCDEGQRAK